MGSSALQTINDVAWFAACLSADSIVLLGTRSVKLLVGEQSNVCESVVMQMPDRATIQRVHKKGSVAETGIRPSQDCGDFWAHVVGVIHLLVHQSGAVRPESTIAVEMPQTSISPTDGIQFAVTYAETVCRQKLTVSTFKDRPAFAVRAATNDVLWIDLHLISYTLASTCGWHILRVPYSNKVALDYSPYKWTHDSCRIVATICRQVTQWACQMSAPQPTRV